MIVPRLVAIGGLAVVACLAAVPAAAQVGSGHPGLRAYGFVETTSMTAADTFDASLGTSSLRSVGAGVDVLRLWHGLFARVGVSKASETGERAVVFGGEVFPLGIPLKVELMPIEAGGGWRGELGPRSATVGVYGGGSYIRLRYRETSEFAVLNEDVDESFNGLAGFVGVDVTLARIVTVGSEVGYRRVPNAIGSGGLSESFGETDLGGLSARVLVGVKF